MNFTEMSTATVMYKGMVHDTETGIIVALYCLYISTIYLLLSAQKNRIVFGFWTNIIWFIATSVP